MTGSSERGKALVTGGTGFIGSHLVDRLIEGERNVRCLVRRTSDLRYLNQKKVEIVYGGLDEATDWEEALSGVSIIYHLGGLTLARRRRDYFEVNHRGTEAIISAALKHRGQIKKFVHISSLAATGPGRDGRPVNENTTPMPITSYGWSKLMGEEAVRAASDLIPITIVRPPAVYGPRDRALNQFFKMIGRGLSPMIGRYDKQLSLVHVSDLIDGILLAADGEASTGRVYFISSEEVYPWNSVVDLVAKLIGRRARSFAIPKGIALVLAVAAESVSALTGKPPVINRDGVKNLSQKCWGCSIERARTELGYRQQISLEDGLRDTINWYRQEGRL